MSRLIENLSELCQSITAQTFLTRAEGLEKGERQGMQRKEMGK